MFYHQNDLFDQLPPWTERDFHGYRQTRFNGEPWKFYVSGFCFDDIHCHVLMTDGTYRKVPIDIQNRIYIEGKYYDKKYWDH